MRETSGSKATAAIVAMYASAGHAEVASDEVPWCAAFVGHCLKTAGLTNTGSLLARSYLTYGTKLEAPRVGCIAVFKRGAPPSGHVAFVTGWGGGCIRVLGGNQGNAVSEINYSEANVLGYRWPNSAISAPDETITSAHAAITVPKPIAKSRTIWNIAAGGSLLTWLGALVNQGMEIVTAAGAQFAAIGPGREMLATIGGNGSTIAWAVGVGCLVSAACAKIDDSNKAPPKPEGEPS